jgi:hypothetical protein
VALEFGMAHWRPERGKSTGARDVWLSPWQAYRRRTNYLERLTAMRWSFKARGARSAGGQLRRTYLDQPRVSSAAKIFSPWSIIRAPVNPNHLGGANPGAGVAGGKVHCTWDLLQLLYHWNPYSKRLTEQKEAPRSPIFMWELVNPLVTKF